MSGSFDRNDIPADQTVTKTSRDLINETETQYIFKDILKELKTINKYLAEMLGEELT